MLEKRLLLPLLAVVMSVWLLTGRGAHGRPQRNSPRGRAISGFSRTNEADYDEGPVEEDLRPGKYGRRGYRSNCRCSRISNCPKIQITIPRCPAEEFVCCFN